MKAVFWILCFSFTWLQAQTLTTYSKDTLLMGCAFTISAVHENKLIAKEAVYAGIAEIDRIESLISSWKPNSQTSLINQNAGVQAVPVNEELFHLITRSLKISEISNGYFDISFASIDQLWTFDGEEHLLPEEELLLQSVAKIQYQNILLDAEKQTVFLKEKGMKIGFGAIGKGYAADQAKIVMQNLGIENGVVNASGDILTWGVKATGEQWNFGIADPNNRNKLLTTLQLQDQAVVTSGNYEKFLLIDGKRYGHIINPKTGMPSIGVSSVTILANTAELADALATTVFVLGEEEGLKLVNHLNGVEAIIINERNISVYSDGISINQINER